MTPTDTAAIVRALRSWLDPAVSADARAWLDDAGSRIAAGAPDRVLFTQFGAAPRRVDRVDLPPHPDLGLVGWSADQAARVALLLLRPADDGFTRALDQLFGAADLGELVCLYQALPLLPWPERHVRRAAEGVRSNMLPVFQAVALRNAYPAAWLDEGAWNQMVLKAVFVGCGLGGITGLDRRANPALARMLADYARERRAASRPVAPDLWRPVGPHAEGQAMLGLLQQALADPDPAQQSAAALALAASPDPAARAILAARPDLAADISAGRVGWN